MKSDSLKTTFGNRPWYAVKCVYYDSINSLYEDRVTLYRAKTADEAMDKAEIEAREICEALDGYEFTGYIETFHLFDEEFKDGVELYSTLRKSKLSKKQYIKKYIRTGNEVGFEEDD